MCGENLPYPIEKTTLPGSPPRVRGKHVRRDKKCSATGITPACAGKTNAKRRIGRIYGDHPRVCGENLARPWRFDTALGSPPRMRGKHDCEQGTAAGRGITPACAGKTRDARMHAQRRGDHPRVCGENMLSMSEPILFAGSPPRMRGKPSLGTAYASGQGITPAHAGKTSVLSYVLEP